MKKIITMLLLVAMVLSLVACGSTPAAPSQSANPQPSTGASETPGTEERIEHGLSIYFLIGQAAVFFHAFIILSDSFIVV
jgi:predicted small lipoprotein YifL